MVRLKIAFKRPAVLALAFFCALTAPRLFGNGQTGAPKNGGGADTYIILCLGDFLTDGLGAPQGRSYPAQLQEMLGGMELPRKVRVVSRSVPRGNSTEIFSLFARDVDAIRPDLVVFQGGSLNGRNFFGYHAYRHPGGKAEGTRAWGKRVLARSAKLRSEIARYENPKFKNDFYSPQSNAYRDLLVKKLAEGDWQEVLALSQKIIDTEPSSVAPYGIIGAIHYVTGRTAEAMESYGKYLKKYPDAHAWYWAGSVYLRERKFRDAFQAFARAYSFNKIACYEFIYDFRELLWDEGAGDVRAEAAAFLKGIKPEVNADARQMIEDMLARHPEAENTDGWRAYDTNRIVDGCRKRGIPVMLLDYPEAKTVMRDVAASRDVPYIDTRAVFAKLQQRDPRSKYFSSPFDNQCNAEGYRVIAETVRNRVLELGLGGDR